VEAGVGASVEMHVESVRSGLAGEGFGMHVQMLGPLTISRDGVVRALPSSRKVRGLLA
jgi:hypothetical protein